MNARIDIRDENGLGVMEVVAVDDLEQLQTSRRIFTGSKIEVKGQSYEILRIGLDLLPSPTLPSVYVTIYVRSALSA